LFNPDPDPRSRGQKSPGSGSATIVKILWIQCQLFYRRELPDYYKAISDPISLNLIKRKMKSGDYSSLQDLADDMGKQ
jgi:hypothetical protein